MLTLGDGLSIMASALAAQNVLGTRTVDLHRFVHEPIMKVEVLVSAALTELSD